MAVPIAAIIQQAAGTTASVVSQYLQGKTQKAYYRAVEDAYNTNAELNDIHPASPLTLTKKPPAGYTKCAASLKMCKVRRVRLWRRREWICLPARRRRC